jgi:hypothetical protein
MRDDFEEDLFIVLQSSDTEDIFLLSSIDAIGMKSFNCNLLDFIEV